MPLTPAVQLGIKGLMGSFLGGLSELGGKRGGNRRRGAELAAVQQNPFYWSPSLNPAFQQLPYATPRQILPPYEQQTWTEGSPGWMYHRAPVRPTPQQTAQYFSSLPGITPGGLDILMATEAMVPGRTTAWTEPARHVLPPEVQAQIASYNALVPSRIGATAQYGGLARAAMEEVSPELGLAGGYLQEGLQPGIPDDLREIWQENIRSGLAARGLDAGLGGATLEARALTEMAEARRQQFLQPAIGFGLGLLESSGLALPTSVSGAAMAQSAAARREADKEASWANAMAWATGATGLIRSASSALGGLAAGGYL